MLRRGVPSYIAISIHAPRTGSDIYPCGVSAPSMYFNPRSPHGERRADFFQCGGSSNFNPRSPHGERLGRVFCCAVNCNFNPRSPHGERRSAGKNCARKKLYFNPRSPHGERLNAPLKVLVCKLISIHAPRTGSDSDTRWNTLPAYRFQSTLPARGATSDSTSLAGGTCISIHAPRTGSDFKRHVFYFIIL